MTLTWLPMRWMIPLLMLGTAAFSSVAFYFYETHQSIRAFEHSKKEDVFRDLFRAASFAEYMLLRQDTAAVTAELSGLATEEGLGALVLVAPDHKVLYASRVAWLDEAVDSIDEDLRSLTLSTPQRMQGHAHFSEDRNSLYVHFPVRFQGDESDIRPMNYGSLVARYDLHPTKQQIYHDVEARLRLFIGLFSLISIFIWLLSHYALTKRVQRIVRSAEAFASGDLQARSALTGMDELGRISDAFDQMADQIQTSIRQQAKLVSAIETMVECVFITDVNGNIEYVNPAFTKVTGYSAAEAVGKNPRFLKSGEHPPEFYQAFWSRLLSGSVWSGQMTDRRKNGDLYYVRSSVVPVTDEKGVISHYVAVQEDITEQLAKDEKLTHAMKMESLGTLVGGIAHEFNNMLAGMVGNLYIARQRAAGKDDVIESIDRIEKLGYRAAEMIKQLLAFSRQGSSEFTSLDLTSFMHETIKLIHVSVPESVELSLDLSDEALVINGDKTQIHQILMNLLANARDAVVDIEKPCISIQLQQIQTDAELRKEHPDAVDSYAMLCVSDNGHGIEEKNISRIFEPFYTTRSVGEGTGLGLSMVFGAVEQHNGFIKLDSTVSQGSSFKLYFPLVDENPHEVDDKQEFSLGYGEKILIADDELAVRETLGEVLVDAGYQIQLAVDGAEAVEYFSADPESFHAVVLDMVMPRLGGVAAAEQMRRIRQDIAVIFQTGYDHDQMTSVSAAVADAIVLNKPVDPSKMLKIIATVVASGK
ncbi:blue-light-activated protein [Mariprofundus micogutta]|uniref:histidine kinase n=1 Tax=Mariprofundus micogutta TaxID=1921010 RepID=A0A1L8CN88_9PROT|nr:PAS domain S-box protein [Mariprofundus micogutta]GAV20378.1 blue-light-activated protein [Mariprofundus micogutta]